MKLKHKMILIVSLITAVTLCIGGVFLMFLLRGNMLKDAYREAEVNAMEFYVEFDRILEGRDGGTADVSLALIYKSRNNWRNVIYKEDQEIYNVTVFRKQELLRAALFDESGMQALEEREELQYEDGKYIVNAANRGEYMLFHIFDITDVHLQIRSMIRNYTLIALGILIVSIGITAFAVRKVLYPLEVLTEATKDMAEGDYSHRVKVTSKDELGSLARHFNDMAEAVEQKQRTLQESERRKTLMMGSLSHELKTPMTAISGYAETLLTTRLSEEQKEEALYYIYEETGRLGRLSGKLMQLLSLSEGDPVEMKDVEVEGLFRGVEETMSRKCSERGVKLILEILGEETRDAVGEAKEPRKADGITDEVREGEGGKSYRVEEGGEAGVMIHTDQDLIRDVLINLVDNAVKASRSGGFVRISWKEGILSVCDEGIGIPPEELDAVTEPFYMVDKSRTRKEGGAGLGLSLTKLILEKLGATMEIRSNPGEGTEVRILGLAEKNRKD